MHIISTQMQYPILKSQGGTILTPIMIQPKEGKSLFNYLFVSAEFVGVSLVPKIGEFQKPMYLIGKLLKGPEGQYQKIEKIVMALMTTSRQMGHYFQAYMIG